MRKYIHIILYIIIAIIFTPNLVKGVELSSREQETHELLADIDEQQKNSILSGSLSGTEQVGLRERRSQVMALDAVRRIVPAYQTTVVDYKARIALRLKEAKWNRQRVTGQKEEDDFDPIAKLFGDKDISRDNNSNRAFPVEVQAELIPVFNRSDEEIQKVIDSEELSMREKSLKIDDILMRQHQEMERVLQGDTIDSGSQDEAEANANGSSLLGAENLRATESTSSASKKSSTSITSQETQPSLTTPKSQTHMFVSKVDRFNERSLEVTDPFCEDDEILMTDQEKSVGYSLIAQSEVGDSVSEKESNVGVTTVFQKNSDTSQTGNRISNTSSGQSVPNNSVSSVRTLASLSEILNADQDIEHLAVTNSQGSVVSTKDTSLVTGLSSSLSSDIVQTNSSVNSDGALNVGLSQNNTSILSGTNLSNVNNANQKALDKKGAVEVVSLNRRPKQILKFNNPNQKQELPQERVRLIEAYNQGEFRGDELYARNKHLGYLKISDFIQDGFMLVETIDKRTGKSSWKVVGAKDLFAYSMISAHAKEFFAQRNNSFPRYIKKSKNLGKEEFSNFRGQGYRAEFIQGLDDANMLVALAQKLKKVHPTKTHIADLEQVVNRHIEFIRRGSQANPENLRNLDREARQRIKSKRLTYLWWLDWNYRLAQVASGKTSSKNPSDIMNHLSSVSFPDTVLLPTNHPIGIIGKNRAYVNDIQIVQLMSVKDKKGKLPSEIFEQDITSTYFANRDRKLMDTYLNRNFKKLSVAERQVIEERYFHKFYSKPQRKVAQKKK